MGKLEINIQSNFMEATEAFDKELGPSDILRATRNAINKTLITLRSASTQELRKLIRIRESTLKEKYIWLEKARGGTVNQVEGAIAYSSRAIPLLEFVKGDKSPIKQKGIRIKDRRRIRVEVTPGHSTKLMHAFIQRVRSVQVFKRKGKRPDFAKQGAPSVGARVNHTNLGNRLVSMGEVRLIQLLRKELQYQADKAAGRIQNGTIK